MPQRPSSRLRQGRPSRHARGRAPIPVVAGSERGSGARPVAIVTRRPPIRPARAAPDGPLTEGVAPLGGRRGVRPRAGSAAYAATEDIGLSAGFTCRARDVPAGARLATLRPEGTVMPDGPCGLAGRQDAAARPPPCTRMGVDFSAARVATEDVAAHRGRAARHDVADGAEVAREHGGPVPRDVARAVAAEDVGEFRHLVRGTSRPGVSAHLMCAVLRVLRALCGEKWPWTGPARGLAGYILWSRGRERVHTPHVMFSRDLRIASRPAPVACGPGRVCGRVHVILTVSLVRWPVRIWPPNGGGASVVSRRTGRLTRKPSGDTTAVNRRGMGASAKFLAARDGEDMTTKTPRAAPIRVTSTAERGGDVPRKRRRAKARNITRRIGDTLRAV